jgi:hypothetical protein
MKDKPSMTHEQINARMSEIGEIFAKYRFTDPPNAKALREELAYLKSIYDDVLTGRRPAA